MEGMNREDLNFYLQQVDSDAVFSLGQKIKWCAEVQIVQQPTEQTLMLPVADPVNQGSFYGGEALVTSAIVRVNKSEGWAMVMDRQEGLALNIAILDGAYAAGVEEKAIVFLAKKGKEIHEKNIKKVEKQVAATRVSFDLL